MKLYHASPVPIEGGTLTPATKNIQLAQTADGTEIAKFTEYDDKNIPYVFATDNPQLSMTYTVPKGLRLGNMHGRGGAEILFMDQESLIGDPDLQGGMYSLVSENFKQIHVDGEGPIDQWVSADSFDLKNAEYVPVKSLNDIMRAGVQIYQVSDSYSAAEFYEEWRKIGNDPDGSQNMDFVKNSVQSGKLRWMNEERGINPVNCLDVPEATVPKPDIKKYVLAS
jgi:hypothetical protein